MNLFHITELVQDYASLAISPGDTVVDGTAGNGVDTVFLAEQVGPRGRVYAFDIQEEAIRNTKVRISEKGYEDRVRLFQDGHENVDQYVQGSIACAMFNLGYLPKGDKTIVTKGDSSVHAIRKSLHLLKVKGILTICIYTSHLGGLEEAALVEDYVSHLDKSKYKVLKFSCLNDKNSPYILLVNRIR